MRAEQGERSSPRGSDAVRRLMWSGLLLTVAVLLSLASTLILIPALLSAFAKPGTAEAV